MDVTVEGGDDFANASFEKICQDIFRDLGVRTNIDQTNMYLDPVAHVFIISVKIGRVTSPVKVGDVTHRDRDKLRITDERYAPKMLAMLWNKYGERVQQLSRLDIGLKLEEKEIEEAKKLVIYDPREDLVTRILDGVDRILPEGARVRYPIPSHKRVTIIASEDAISDDWKKKAEKIARLVE